MHNNSWHIRGLGDFNGDGKPDVLWHNDNGTVVVWMMNGVNVQSQTTPMSASGGTGGWEPAAIGDFDSDGTDDVFWRNTNGNNNIRYMTGT